MGKKKPTLQDQLSSYIQRQTAQSNGDEIRARSRLAIYMDLINKCLDDVSVSKKALQEYSNRIYRAHGIPIDISMDYLTKRKDFRIQPDYVVYALGEAFNISAENVFEKDRLDDLKDYKYANDKPSTKKLEYEMIQVADDQWIGKITVKELMQLREAQIINYNSNTQRVMKLVNRGNEEVYEVVLNQRAIRSMEELFRSGQFISNTITLNMPEDTNYTYRNGILSIKNIKHFDITDGYHRYVAMSNLYNEDNEFDYPMELRITCYSEDRSRQLIWQEDQKTKMARIDSNSLNTNSLANKVVQRLNVSPLFDLAGELNANDGIINSAEMAEIIRATYFPVSKIFSKKQELEALKTAEQEIRDGINAVVSQDETKLEHKWKRDFLYCLIYNINKKVSQEELLSKTEAMKETACDIGMFRGREVTRIDMKRLAEMSKGGRRNNV